jgi:hypothetical protein
MNITERVSSGEKWRRLCEMIAVEADPHRLSDLVNQLVKELDARRETIRQEETQGFSRSTVSGGWTSERENLQDETE